MKAGRIGLGLLVPVVLCACVDRGHSTSSEPSTSTSMVEVPTSPPQPLATDETTTSIQTVTFSLADAQRLESGLSSHSPEEFLVAFAPVVALALSSDDLGRAMLPEGSSIDIDLSTFVAGSPSTGSVKATVLGATQDVWLVLLQRVGDEWLVYGTQRLPDS